MTDEEKAIELQQNDVCMIWNNGCPNIREAALKMAEWKDEQFAEERKELLALVQILPVDSHNQMIIEDLLGLLS